MFRRSRSGKDKGDKHPIDIYEPSRPRSINESTNRTFTTSKSVPVPRAVIRPADPSFHTEGSVLSPRQAVAYDAWAVPRLIKTPWELERAKQNSTQRRSRPVYRFPIHVFKNLPTEVYNCIVAQLEQMYQDRGQACSSCHLRDLHSLSLTSRAWGKVANTTMYHKALVLASEENDGLPKLRTKGTSRLKLLRRTLRDNSGLARRVQELHMHGFQSLYQNATIEREEIANLVASLVMACPCLERLVGFHIPTSQTFDRLSHALSTRPNLKERVLILADTDADVGVDDDDEDEDRLRGIYIAECDPIERFLELSSTHSALSTLILHQEKGQSSTSLNFRAIVGTFRNSPSMRHLTVSGLSANSFTNMALNAIPANLESLRLEDLPGITEKGIQRFATSEQAVSIRKLALIDLNIESIATIADILSTHLASLREFSLVQARAPILPYRSSEPNFWSPSLRYIHWELCSEASPLPPFVSPSIELPESQPFPFTNHEPTACLATSLLAAAIQAHAFPSLSRIRIPHDPQGVIQSLCKPLATALLPSDTSKFATASRISTSDGFSIMLEESAIFTSKIHNSSAYQATSASRVDSVVGSPMFDSRRTEVILTPMRSRLAAQSRILAARKCEHMIIRVVDPEGKVRVHKVVGSYVGRIYSKITYDMKTAGRSEWIPGIADLVGDQSTDLKRSRRSCGHLVNGGTGLGVMNVEDLF